MDVPDEMFWLGLAYHRLGSLFSSPPWIEALIRTYGFGISAAARVRNGTVGDTIPFSTYRTFGGTPPLPAVLRTIVTPG